MVNTYTLSDVQGFETFCHNTHIRDAIFTERGLKGVAEFLQSQLLNTYNPHSHLQTKTPLLQQLAKHYSNVQISQAIAQAWLDDSDTFSLPKLGFVERYGKIKIVAIGTFLTVVPFMTWLTLELRKDYPGTIGVMLALEPLIALPAAITWVTVFWLVMKWWK
jgi:hypothetical protein